MKPHSSSLLLAAALLAGAASAQSNPGGANPGNGPAFASFQSAHGQNWRQHLDLETGYVQFLYGGKAAATFEARSDAEYVELALGFFGEVQPLFGIEPATFVTDGVVLLPLGLAGTTDKMAVNFRQEVNGVPVVHGSANALFHLGGELLALDATGLPNVAGFDTTPTIEAAAATRFALEAFGVDTGLSATLVSEPVLVIDQEVVGGFRVPTLAWEIRTIFSREGFDPEGNVYLIAAQDALRVVSKSAAIHHFDVGGTVNSNSTPGTKPDTTGNPEIARPMRYMRVTSSAGTVFTNSSGVFNFPGATGPLSCTFFYDGTYNNVDNDAGSEYTLVQSLTGTGNSVLMNPTSTATITSQSNAFYGVNEDRDYIRAANPADNKADFVHDANVNQASTCNAFYDGVSINFFSAGGGCNNTAYSTVIAHEDGHWMNDQYGSGNGFDGFGEGNADVLGMYVHDNAIVGDDFFTSGGDIRTGLNLRQYCGDGNGGCYGEVHADGEVLMGALWKVRANLNTSLGNTLGDTTSNVLWSGWMNLYNQATIHSVIETQWLTLDDDNGDLSDGSPHDVDIDAGFVAQGFPGFLPPPPPADASATTRNGTGINPNIFVSLSLPVIGTNWLSKADATAQGAGGIVVMFAFDGALVPGVVLGFGELLVDVGTPLEYVNFGLAPIANFSAPIPNDASIEGFLISAQVYYDNPLGGPFLTNAIDLVLGF